MATHLVWCQPARSASWQDSGMDRVVGIGGYFMRAADPAALGAWYRDFQVRDLDAMLAQLRARGADVAPETQDMEGVGRFGWVIDPEGNRVELWQPAVEPGARSAREVPAHVFEGRFRDVLCLCPCYLARPQPPKPSGRAVNVPLNRRPCLGCSQVSEDVFEVLGRSRCLQVARHLPDLHHRTTDLPASTTARPCLCRFRSATDVEAVIDAGKLAAAYPGQARRSCPRSTAWPGSRCAGPSSNYAAKARSYRHGRDVRRAGAIVSWAIS